MDQATKKDIANIRKDILYLVYKGGGHVGGSMSIVETLYVLYKNFLSKNENDFILSKGHSVQALYAILKKFNVIDKEIFKSYGEFGTKLIHHPYIFLQGINYSSGALGNGLSVGIGMALSNSLNKDNRKVFVLMGDGELNEGSVWEGLMYAASKKINGIIALIDHNGLQSSDRTDNIIKSKPLFSAIESLGWHVEYIDGHNVDAIKNSINKNWNSEIPVAIVLETTKGKGVSFMENEVSWHHKTLSKEDYDKALEEVNNYGD